MPHSLPKKDTANLGYKPISQNELVYLVDSILDLDSISPAVIKMLSYYKTELDHQKNEKLSTLPASELYTDFDDKNCFVPAASECVPDTLKLALTSDSLGSYFAPICGVITSNYGWRDNRMHKGIDIDLNRGDQVHAAFDGMVRLAKYNGGYGNVVIVRHYNGLETVYAHLSKIKVKSGQVVIAGQTIGLGGATGHATGSHLHFEVRFMGHALNPAQFISFTEHKILEDSLVIRKSKYGMLALPAHATVYTVQRGDSWYEIIKRYGINSKQLCALNGTTTRFYLRAGQKIRVN
ncbi:MAG: peptidoglycan DD-metalloendopeptidase family protein [Bacteroidetes bacterium]|nr:peptidoglycan DD-metalloendopeptidase family protein [Bacteroidota bacterium]